MSFLDGKKMKECDLKKIFSVHAVSVSAKYLDIAHAQVGRQLLLCRKER